MYRLPVNPVVSSRFSTCLLGRVLVRGDCAVNAAPTNEEVAAIAAVAVDTAVAAAAAAFGITARLALLSLATGNSNRGVLKLKVMDATAKARRLLPNFWIEGTLQATGAAAMGPSMQGPRRPVNDRCTVPDSVTTIAPTPVQAAATKEISRRDILKDRLVASAA